MRRTLLIPGLALLMAAHCGYAQNLPFDMSPERPAQEMPPAIPDQPADGSDDAGAAQNAPVIVPAQNFRRFVLPGGDLSLSGEIAERAWSIYLTPEQAASAATFNIGYQNSILVAPEASRLSVSINDVALSEENLGSAEGVAEFNLTVPKGLLKPGANLVRLSASSAIAPIVPSSRPMNSGRTSARKKPIWISTAAAPASSTASTIFAPPASTKRA